MNSAVLSSSEVNHSVLSRWEVDTETTSVDKGHVALFVALNTTEYILLVGVSLAFQLHQLCEFESLLHAPLDDTAVARD